MSIPSSAPSPRWLGAAELPPTADAAVRDWLFDQGSLTRRLTALASGAFDVTPLAEGWQPLRDEECAALGVAPGSQGWVREVFLRGHGQPWVFARSVAAKSVLQIGGFDMEALGARSLGGLLFSDNAFERGPMQVCQYPRGGLPVADQADGLWARRSRFSRGPLSVLVAEVFLPNLWAALSARSENN